MSDTDDTGPGSTGPGGRGRGRLVRSIGAGAATAAGLVALATAGLAGTAGTASAGAADHTVDLHGSFGTRTVVLDGENGTATASPAPSSSPHMRLQLAYQRVGRTLTLTVSLDGHVYEPLDAAGKPAAVYPTPAGIAIGLGQNLAWGDGTGLSSTTPGVHCGKPQTLHQMGDSFTVSHKFAKAGTFTVTYTFRACGLTDQKITASLPVRVS